MNKPHKSIVVWLRLSLIVVILMVIIGGLTRLTQSGLSITYWKPVTGIIPPTNIDQWMYEFNEYKKYPEYNKLNLNMSINEYKTIYYWEYLHRMIGRFIGLLFFFPFIYFYYKSYLNKKLIQKLLFLFFLGVFQGFLGWYMVKSGLVDNPHISHYRLSLHLVLAFFIIGYIYKTELLLRYPIVDKVSNYLRYNKFINIIIIVLFIQIIYGAFTAGLKAGQFWNTFPLINGKIVPDDLFAITPVYLNFIEHNKLIQFMHRYIGLFLLILIYIYSFKIKDINLILNIKSRNLITLVTCQVFLGIITLISKAPIILASSHQIVAIFLLLQLINTKHFLKYK